MLEWLSFVNSELHKGFSPLFAPHSNDGAKAYARDNLANRLGWLNGVLGSKKHLTGEPFTVADAYAFVVLNWTGHVGIDMGQWPNLQRLQGTIGARPHVLAALKAEGLIQ